MRIRIGSGLFLLNLLVIALILVVIFSPSSSSYNVFRIILGLPLVLFSPGYALVAALFPKREGLDIIERMALSFGLSIVAISLIGLVLNYTPLGIKLEPVLYSASGFTFIISIIAIWRRVEIPEEDRFSISSGLKLPGWNGGVFGKLLSVLVLISILGALGMLGYYIASPKVEPFTEFYILGPYDTQDYPTEFVMQDNDVTLVKYGEEKEVLSGIGTIILGITNYEHEEASFQVGIILDNSPVKVYIDGDIFNELGPIVLNHEENWEQEIGFAPEHVGNEQKVEFVLYKDGIPYFEEPLHLWIDVSVQD